MPITNDFQELCICISDRSNALGIAYALDTLHILHTGLEQLTSVTAGWSLSCRKLFSHAGSPVMRRSIIVTRICLPAGAPRVHRHLADGSVGRLG